MQHASKRQSQSSGILRIFLCHSSGDKPAVRDLYARLRDDGFESWFDEQSLRPGQDWDYEIRKAVSASDIVIVCLSRASTTKAGYLHKELGFALDVANQQPEGSIFILPVKLEECDVPKRLKKWQWVNLFMKEGYSQLIESLNFRASQAGRQITPNRPITASNSSYVDSIPLAEPVLDKDHTVQQQKYSVILAKSRIKRRAIAGIAGYGALFIVVMFIIAIRFQHPSFFQYTVFRIIVALVLTGIAIMVSRLVGFKIDAVMRAGGAIAIFSVAYFFSPTRIVMGVVGPTADIAAIMPLADGSLSVRFSNGNIIELVPVPSGSFEMGSTDEEVKRAQDEYGPNNAKERQYILQETPKHLVNITKSFWMGKFEVTQAQWQTVMDKRPSFHKDCDLCPVEQVSWNDVQEFVRRLNDKQRGYIFRLPTEAEWEYAARAGTTTEFGFGNTLTSAQANFNGSYPAGLIEEMGPLGSHTRPVGSYPRPNRFGLFDMHGNVWEWVDDIFDPGYYKHSPVDDPTGPTSGSLHGLRGGSFDNIGVGCRSAQRASDDGPSTSTNAWGFRLVCVLRR